MNINHILYLVSPFGLGLICFKFVNGNFWFCVGLGCIASVFTFTKLILPAQEQKFNAIKDIDIESAYKDKMSEQKPYSYIAGFHMLLFFSLIILYFIN
jgi:hypothetical protein